MMLGNRNGRREFPRIVAVETTSHCNAKCEFCPNSALERGRQHMSEDLFDSILEQCAEFPLEAFEPFLQGEPFADPNIMSRLEKVRGRLPQTRLRLYTNGFALTPQRTDALCSLGVDHLYVSLNSLDPSKYQSMMGLRLERTLENIRYLADPSRRARVARKITVRMTRTQDTTLAEQDEFVAFCQGLGVKPFIVGLFNYKGDILSDLPVPGYPCEHITRLDILADGRVALCCMDQEGKYSWGDVTRQSLLEVYWGEVASRYRRMQREGNRHAIAPCDRCNVFWPSFDHLPLVAQARFGVQAGWYFLQNRPYGRRAPRSGSRVGA